jgi:hypothetical protein
LTYSSFTINKTHINRKAKAIDPEFAPAIPEKTQWQPEE